MRGRLRAPCAAGTAAVLAAAVVASAGQFERAQPRTPLARYRDLLALYAAGQSQEAVRALDQWEERQLGDAARTARTWPSGDLKQAAMLHADRELAEMQARLRAMADMDEACVTGPHASLAGTFVRLLETRGPDREFARRWHLALAAAARAVGCMETSLQRAAKGLEAFPRDPQLMLAWGAVAETTASMARSFDARALLDHRPSQRAKAARGGRDRNFLLTRARQRYEDALREDPTLHEARLRLGRVQWRTGELDAARATLQALPAAPSAPDVAYLAALFLGRVEEDAGRLAAAEQAYRQALSLRPEGQAAAIGLSHVLLEGGQAEAARAVLQAAVAAASRPNRFEAYWTYMLGEAGLADEALEALRLEARQ